MKKFCKGMFLLASVLVILSGCGNGESKTADSGKKKEKADIAMITDKGDINDKSFNQGTWTGIKNYAEKHNKSYQYYRPIAVTNDDYIAMIEQAIQNGSKIVVTPGFLFSTPVFTLQEKYPDVKFVLVDGWPNDGDEEKPEYKTTDNTTGILFAEEQAGFLAGYAAVKEGYEKLGFMGGMAVPAVVKYGYGYIEGANVAAKEMNKKVEVSYYYTGAFEATPEAQAFASGWYNEGTEVIFSCGGPLGNSVMAAAEASNKKVIGVDVDQSGESDTVITSAAKDLNTVMADVLDQFYNDKFPGGKNQTLGAEQNAVFLPMENSKFEKFTEGDYEAIYKKLADGDIKVSTDESVKSPEELKVDNVKVKLVK